MSEQQRGYDSEFLVGVLRGESDMREKGPLVYFRNIAARPALKELESNPDRLTRYEYRMLVNFLTFQDKVGKIESRLSPELRSEEETVFNAFESYIISLLGTD